MIGLSLTAIGMRSLPECIDIYKTLESPLNLEFLELAIGTAAHVDFSYEMPLVLHDSCLYETVDSGCRRLKIDLLRPETWKPYRDFIRSHNVLAMSIHPPLWRECSRSKLIQMFRLLQFYLEIPLYLEVMPSHTYWNWHHSARTEVPLLIDVSHCLIWHEGDQAAAEKTCLQLIQEAPDVAIHLSHNDGRNDRHDLIPENVWFNCYLADWGSKYLVTYESLPKQYGQYERLDKQNKRLFIQQVMGHPSAILSPL